MYIKKPVEKIKIDKLSSLHELQACDRWDQKEEQGRVWKSEITWVQNSVALWENANYVSWGWNQNKRKIEVYRNGVVEVDRGERINGQVDVAKGEG